ncbi:Tyrosinase [Lasiodiplodia hormozganensis]|uniref:tyrosinase n=1 Tax=Lasiodiplodia hormozganensis TaxID=869390 RepID=A0AA39Z580_9PEZI|nr:Tyrosinase [Lasiodiplodia hormozganensis]
MASLAEAQNDGIVIGLRSVSGVHPRHEIDYLVKNEPDMFNLFLLAIESLQHDETKMGFFQVCGIHGLPKRDWDGVRGDKPQRGGYCTHNSILFPTWHRPYLSMFEQTVYNTIERIAAQFKDPKYREAAKRFRLPYWDYLHAREEKQTVFPGVFRGRKTSFPYDFRLPLVLKADKLMVYRPGATETTLVPMDNPLKTFVFPQTGSVAPEEWAVLEQQVEEEGGGYHLSRRRTARHPRPGQSGEQEDYDELDAALNKDREPEVQTLLDLIELQPYADYRNFATSVPAGGSDQEAPPSGSLESWHGAYHVLVGGAGHMSRVPVAAFDPVFWFHHCNIDRVLAIWQALHDDYISNTSTGGQPNAHSNLYPFRKEKQEAGSPQRFWNSADSRDIGTFGYTYPELMGKFEHQGLLKRIDANYRWSLQRQSRPGGVATPAPPEEMKPVDVRNAQVFRYKEAKGPEAIISPPVQAAHLVQQKVLEVKDQAASAVRGNPGSADDALPSFDRGDEILANEPEGTRLVLQWYIDSEVNKDALDGAFSIYFFIGPTAAADVDDDEGSSPLTWPAEPTLAGITHVFAAPKDACDNCALQSDEGLRVTGTTTITPILLDYVEDGQLPSIAPPDVVPFLKKNLIWRVADVNQRKTDPAEVPGGLKISVSATISVLRPEEAMPEFREPLLFHEITESGEA